MSPLNNYKLSHRDELAQTKLIIINKILIKNQTSILCSYSLKSALFSYTKKVLRCSYLFISTNMGFTGAMAKVYRALMEWQVQSQDSSRLIKVTLKQDLVKLIL